MSRAEYLRGYSKLDAIVRAGYVLRSLGRACDGRDDRVYPTRRGRQAGTRASLGGAA